METPELCSRLDIHQTLEVIYTVNGYEATLYHDGGYLIFKRATGDTVIEAILALESELVKLK